MHSDSQPAGTRRGFLISTAAAAGGAVLAGCETMVGEGESPGHVDAHVHVWTPDTAAYPLAEGFSTKDMVPASFTPEELLGIARPNGVSRVVLIQMSFYRFDNRFMLDAMRRFPGVFSGVGIVDEQAPLVRDRMRDLAKQGVRGFRISPGRQAADAWLGSAGMTAMWTAAADENLAICPLINPAALPALADMCSKFPRTRVVVDHFARIGVDGQFREADLDNLCALAKFPNTFVKTSAFYALGRREMPYLDLEPMIHRVRDAFGARRLMWASDCPYQVQGAHTYDASLSLVRDRLPFLSAEDRAWILRRTAEKVFFSGSPSPLPGVPHRRGT